MVSAMELDDRCNIWKPQCNPVLVKGQKWCPHCNGLGASFVNISFKLRSIELRKCFMCKGAGKVDWITAITKRPDDPGSIYKADNIKEVSLKCSGQFRCKKRLKRLWQKYKNFYKVSWNPTEY